MPQIDCGTVDFTAIDDPVELDLVCDVAPLVAPVQEGLQLLPARRPLSTLTFAPRFHEAAERLVHHNFVEGHGRRRRRDAFDEVDAVLLA